MIKVTKTELPIDQRLDAKVTGEPENLNEKDKLSVLQAEYTIAKSAVPNYETLKKELSTYSVELPTNPDIGELSKINKLYAIAQSFASRVTAIEMVAIDNHARWGRLHNFMEGYIEDRESALLITEDVMSYGNAKLQQAKVRTMLKKEYATFATLQTKLSEAESFKRMVETRKKDLASVLTTLGKQVKALSVEQNLMH
jgi:hypothetical protein